MTSGSANAARSGTSQRGCTTTSSSTKASTSPVAARTAALRAADSPGRGSGR
jgi:hypothetical protein